MAFISYNTTKKINIIRKELKLKADELNITNTRLKSLDRAKSNFFANISHEIRTPLTLIMTPIESVISSNYTKKIDNGFIDMLHRNASRLLDLINNLLDFSKLDAGRMAMKARKLNLVEFVTNHTGVVQSLCELKGINLQVETSPDAIELYADRDMLDKIISNLLSNAIKFTDTGGSILVRVSKNENNCIIEVTDTGIGIPADKADTIFDRFTQVDSSSTRKYEGTGIGLSLVREFVDLHQGKITVTSRHVDHYPTDHGSTFIVSLPLGETNTGEHSNIEGVNTPSITSAAQYADIATSFVDTKSNAAHSILDNKDEIRPVLLIVEDHADMHHLLHDILADQYSLVTAYNGKEALSSLDSMEILPDLILTDVMMPQMDGYELTRHIRANQRYEGIPIILLTAKADDAMILEGFEQGATDYIIKPFNARELMARIEAQLEMKVLRDKLVHANEKLYAELKASYASARPNTSETTMNDETEEKARLVAHFIKQNFTSDLSREGLAAAVGISADYLSRVFNKVMGKRIDEYINELRLEEAKKRLVETDDTVISIAFGVGFDNVRTFNNVFMKATGSSPTEWRRKGYAW